jgi:hypothetical protein
LSEGLFRFDNVNLLGIQVDGLDHASVDIVTIWACWTDPIYAAIVGGTCAPAVDDQQVGTIGTKQHVLMDLRDVFVPNGSKRDRACEEQLKKWVEGVRFMLGCVFSDQLVSMEMLIWEVKSCGEVFESLGWARRLGTGAQQRCRTWKMNLAVARTIL